MTLHNSCLHWLQGGEVEFAWRQRVAGDCNGACHAAHPPPSQTNVTKTGWQNEANETNTIEVCSNLHTYHHQVYSIGMLIPSILSASLSIFCWGNGCTDYTGVTATYSLSQLLNAVHSWINLIFGRYPVDKKGSIASHQKEREPLEKVAHLYLLLFTSMTS